MSNILSKICNLLFGSTVEPVSLIGYVSQPQAPTPTAPPQKPVSPAIKPVQSLVIDGKNLIHGSHNGQSLSLLNVLALVSELNSRKIEFKCFFDANTFFTLLHAGKKAEAYAYRRLCHDYPDLFIEVPCGNRADDFLLDYVNRGDATIISNDKYRDFAGKYA